jgi:hypothetical protein
MVQLGGAIAFRVSSPSSEPMSWRWISWRHSGLTASGRMEWRKRRQNARGRHNTSEFSPPYSAVSRDFHLS